MQTENEIVGRAIRGDRDAVGELYQLYYRRIYAFFYYRTFDHIYSRESVNETFVRVLEGITHYVPRAEFGAWLYKIAASVARDKRRYERASKRMAEEISIDDAGGNTEALLHKIFIATGGRSPDTLEDLHRWAEQIQRKIDSFSPVCRNSFLYCVVEGGSREDACQEFGYSLNQVRSGISRARTALRGFKRL